MWQQKDAYIQVEAFFREGEKMLFMCRLSRFSLFSKVWMLCLLTYVAGTVCAMLFLHSRVWVGIAAVCGAAVFLYLIVTRCICSSYLVMTQHSLYRWYRKWEPCIDEFSFSDIQSIVVKTWRFFPSYATVHVSRRALPFHKRAKMQRIYMHLFKYHHPERIDFRKMALREPFRLRLVMKQKERFLAGLQQIAEYENCLHITIRKDG